MNICITVHRLHQASPGSFIHLDLRPEKVRIGKGSYYLVFACVCDCMYACARLCVRACVCVDCVHVCALVCAGVCCVWVHACVRVFAGTCCAVCMREREREKKTNENKRD